MSQANQDYVFVKTASNASYPSPVPDDDSAWRLWKKQPASAESGGYFQFHNGALDYQREHGITPMAGLFDVHVAGYSWYVTDEKYQQLLALNLPKMRAQRMRYSDHLGQHYDNYWIVDIGAHHIDVLDRSRCELLFDDDDGEDADGNLLYSYGNYSLDDQALANYAEHQKLMFRLTGVSLAGMVMHKSLCELLGSPAIRFVAIEDHGL